MTKIALTTIIMVMFIGGFFLAASFSSSSELVALSDEVMDELIGGCKIGATDGNNYSAGRVRAGRGSLKKCKNKKPCPTVGEATWIFARVACEPCKRGKNRLEKECGYYQLKSRCKLDASNKCKRKLKYEGSEWSCDHGYKDRPSCS